MGISIGKQLYSNSKAYAVNTKGWFSGIQYGNHQLRAHPNNKKPLPVISKDCAQCYYNYAFQKEVEELLKRFLQNPQWAPMFHEAVHMDQKLLLILDYAANIYTETPAPPKTSM